MILFKYVPDLIGLTIEPTGIGSWDRSVKNFTKKKFNYMYTLK